MDDLHQFADYWNIENKVKNGAGLNSSGIRNPTYVGLGYEAFVLIRPLHFHFEIAQHFFELDQFWIFRFFFPRVTSVSNASSLLFQNDSRVPIHSRISASRLVLI